MIDGPAERSGMDGRFSLALHRASVTDDLGDAVDLSDEAR